MKTNLGGLYDKWVDLDVSLGEFIPTWDISSEKTRVKNKRHGNFSWILTKISEKTRANIKRQGNFMWIWPKYQKRLGQTTKSIGI